MDPETQARLEALLEAAGISGANRGGGGGGGGEAAKHLTDPEVSWHFWETGMLNAESFLLLSHLCRC